MLGVENAGKSQIGHVLAGTERIDFSPTKGIRVFNINVKGRAIKLMEIGGSESVRDLWPHYYNEVGISFVHSYIRQLLLLPPPPPRSALPRLPLF